ncbi:hypothetical protein PAXINDRAFT_15707 [Paxillus involutus ATCC 200175]|uniref:Uncharacterized protein n=1 Tax=Paxillus involutus ATCC 200175 TaxID=664439 RepID=A0A0C9T6Q3_PAXIN|nr:hypothetical protein PAXINDRAFT_15707 [Paxillus involutus ATCC 200175]
MPPDNTPNTPPDTNSNTPAVNLKRKSCTSPDRSNLDPSDTSSIEMDTDPDDNNEATPCYSSLPFSTWKVYYTHISANVMHMVPQQPQCCLGSKTSRHKPVKRTMVQQKHPATSHDEQHNIPLPNGDKGSQNVYPQDKPVGSQTAHDEQHDNQLPNSDESQNAHPQNNSVGSQDKHEPLQTNWQSQAALPQPNDHLMPSLDPERQVSPPRRNQGSEELTPLTNGDEQAEKPESHLDLTDHEFHNNMVGAHMC